ncbi:transposase [bacterium]|nr:transposase [bacterium]
MDRKQKSNRLWYQSDYHEYVSHSEKAEIDRRLEILNFRSRHGLDATLDAFHISRSTFYQWKKKLEDSSGRLIALAPGSRAPKNRRKRECPPEVMQFILEYRRAHPGVCQDAVKKGLDKYCGENGSKLLSTSTIARLIRDLKESGRLADHHTKLTYNAKTMKVNKRLSKKKKKLRRGKYQPEKPGDLVQMDTVERFVFGLKRYVITAVDLKTRIAFAFAYRSKSSAQAKDFLIKLQRAFPFEIKRIQTDNGSEFMKYFAKYISDTEMIHYYNYPRRPKMNAYIESYNKTISSQYIYPHLDELEDVEEFNVGLMEYLIWYNTEKPHSGLAKMSPMEYYMENFMDRTQKSNMLWHQSQA